MLPCIDQEFEAHLKLKHVKLGEGLAARLPDKIRDLHKLFQPTVRRRSTWTLPCTRGRYVPLSSGEPSQVSLRPKECRSSSRSSIIRFERAVGSGRLQPSHQHVDCRSDGIRGGQASLSARLLDGRRDGRRTSSSIFAGNDIPIDEKRAPGAATKDMNLQKFAESFRATGKVDVKSHIRREGAGPAFRNEFHIPYPRCDDPLDNFPFFLEDVSGNLDIYPDHGSSKEFHGRHGPGQVLLHGQSTPKGRSGEHGISLEIKGENVRRWTMNLRKALHPMPGLGKSWSTFSPQGRLDSPPPVNRPSSDPADLEVRVNARGCSVRPTFFPYRIQEVRDNSTFTTTP